MNWILALVIGIVVGFLVSLVEILNYIRAKKDLETVGTLKIAQSDEGAPYMFLELNRNISELKDSSVVKMNVMHVKPKVPQK